MSAPARPIERDPIGWCALIALLFLALAWHRLGIPSKIYFDEIHYVHAARIMLTMQHPFNPEHPLFGKEAIAASIALFGDRPLVWRIPSVILGTLGLFAFGRALWFASLSRFATLSGMVLLATDFAWFIQSRIAMLDMVMAGMAMIAFWQVAAVVRQPERLPRLRLAIAGVCLGLSIGAKWSVVPAAVLPGLAFLAFKIRDNGWRFAFAKAGGPVPGITLIEAAFWLGVLPLAVYWATFMPAFFYAEHAIDPTQFIAQHQYMLRLQDSVIKHHPYMSQWYQWVVNWRAIWYLYEVVDGYQRGIVLIGNPYTMLAGLPALLWCAWAGVRHKRWDALACVLLYAVSLAMWGLSGKPVQFYYHYLLPGTFMMAALALALDALRRRGHPLIPGISLVLSAGLFVYFYPIISAGALHHGRQSYAEWMWLKSWR